MSIQSERSLRRAVSTLLPKGDHWVPVSIAKELTGRDRSSPTGPVITAMFSATIEANQIVGWRQPQFEVREVCQDDSLEPYDLVDAIAGLEAFNADAKAKSLGIVGVNQSIRNRNRKNPADQIPQELQRAALSRATVQIMDRLHGLKAAGVRIYE